MPSFKNKPALSGAVRWTVPAALCSVAMMGAWLSAPGASAASAAAGGHAASPPAASSAQVIHSVAKVASAKSVLSYWTRARLKAAKSVDLVVAGAKSHVLPATGTPSGKPGHIAGGLPGGKSLAAARPGKGIALSTYPYPYPYDSFTPASGTWHNYPYRVNGKLFFTNNGSGFVCSATAVASVNGTKNENEIWTAGHCLVNTEANNQVVDSSAIFIPAYNGNVVELRPVRRIRLERRLEHEHGLVQQQRSHRGRIRHVGRHVQHVREDARKGRGLGRVRLELPRQ